MLYPLPPNPTVADVARERGMEPVAVMIDLALETNFDQFFVQTIAPFDHDRVKTVLQHPRNGHGFFRLRCPCITDVR